MNLILSFYSGLIEKAINNYKEIDYIVICPNLVQE